MTAGVVRIGTSGWSYTTWRGVFYPKGLKREDELVHAAKYFRAIEINGTFYGMQRPEAFAGWAKQVPADFVFSVKAPRYITHILRLRDARMALATFMASGLLRLGIHLGPILWQFPPNFRFDPSRIEAFLRLLPRDTASASALGRMHGGNVNALAWLEIDSRRPIRHAFDVRHESFRCTEFIDLLRAYNVAVVNTDLMPGSHVMDITSDFVYCRLRGSQDGLIQEFDNNALEQWARRINAWVKGGEPADIKRVGAKSRPRRRDVFIFFDNDKKVRAPANAMELIRRLRS